MSAKAAILLSNDKVLGYIENAALHSIYGYAPTDPDERLFLLMMIGDD